VFYGRAADLKQAEGYAEAFVVIHLGLVMIDTYHARLPDPASQLGDTLIEVLISSLIVGLIVVGTLIGFDAVDGLSAQEREHNEAATLADQSQSQLRTDPATVLQTLGSTGHSYTQAIGGTTYTIKQTAELLPASGSNATCNVTSTKRQSGNAFSIVSTVTWRTQEARRRKAVTASSVITPPTGSALEVDVDNAPVATSGVSGVTALVTYIPVESSSTASVQQTTGSQGCVVFGGIPATSAIVEINETPGYVTVSGASKYPTKEVTIAPNYTTHYEVIYNQAGAIQAEFNYKGLAEYEHFNNEGSGKVKEKVTGDTFVALNTKMKVTPEFELGSTKYGASIVAPYEPLPSTYLSSATTEKNLFPFTSGENSYSVYAGDCTENNPETITSKVVTIQEKVVVNPGATTSVKVPMSYVTLNVYKGTNTASGLETSNHFPVTVTNIACKEVTPDNEVKINEPTHKQETSTGAENGAHLEHPFQPFGEGRLCLAYNSGSKHYTYKTTYKLAAEEQYPRNIFLGQTAKYTEKVKRLPSKTEENVEVLVSSFPSTATCP
jgi:type II secretory pathway pseudopilin PulG